MASDARKWLEKAESEWTVDRHGVIRDPGKYEAEPLYVAYFHELVLDGASGDTIYDEYDTPIDTFDIDDDDRAAFPELGGAVHIAVWENDQGFVSHKLFDSKYKLARWVEKIEEAAAEAGEGEDSD